MKKLLAFLLTLALCVPIPARLAAEAEDLFSDKDRTEAAPENATAIVLNGETVTIDKAGTYAVSGEIANGALRVALAEEGTVYLLLNGVTVHNDQGAALYTENCKKVILTLAAGTSNTLSQGAAGDENEDAALYSKDDVTINGAGALTVTGAYKDGINCRDSFKLVSGSVTVSAADDGVVGKDAVIVGGGTLNITAVNDGIKATNEEDETRGYVTLAGGDVTIVTTGTSASGDAGNGEANAAAGAATQAEDFAPSEGMTPPSGNTPPEGGTPPELPEGMTPPQGDSMADTTAGTADPTTDAPTGATTQTGRPGKGGGRGGFGGPGGGFDRGGFGGMAGEGNQTKLTSSAKGVKAVTTLTVSGGTLNVNAADDALHAKDVVLSGGEMTLASGDDGVHGDDSLLISGGTVVVTQSYEGLEAANITIAGGQIDLTASDDGVNGAGGDLAEQAADSATAQTGRGFFGGDWFASSTGQVVITGGTLTVNARGDGLDSNGDIAMSGGQVYVSGPTNSGNGALDYSGSFAMTGGTLVAVGASGMAQGVSALSVAGTMLTVSGTAGTLAVKDGGGNTVISMETTIAYDNAVIYSDLLIDGGSYTVVTPGGEQTATMSMAATTGGMGWGRR